jgi:cold shock CspA family protein
MISRRLFFMIGTFASASGVLGKMQPAAAGAQQEFTEAATMTWFNRVDGFGFLLGNESGHEIYVDDQIMADCACGRLWRGDRVLVRWSLGPKGCMARAIVREEHLSVSISA